MNWPDFHYGKWTVNNQFCHSRWGCGLRLFGGKKPCWMLSCFSSCWFHRCGWGWGGGPVHMSAIHLKCLIINNRAPQTCSLFDSSELILQKKQHDWFCKGCSRNRSLRIQKNRNSWLHGEAAKISALIITNLFSDKRQYSLVKEILKVESKYEHFKMSVH